jgi:hypothetical protein
MKNVTVVKMMMMETLKCFNCHIDKPLEKYKDNKRNYQIKSAKGKCIVCKACSFHEALKTLSVVRYDFEEKNFKVIHFKNQYEVLDFFENEGGEL